MRFISFASSSKGNCALISYKNTNLLVDCGISKKRLVECLSKYSLTLNDIDCILITHEHSDHISGLKALLKDRDIKIISQRDTLKYIVKQLDNNGIKTNLNNFKIIAPANVLNDNSYIMAKDIKFYPLKGCHDVPSLYYKFVLGDVVVAIMTDIGRYTDYNIKTLSDVNYLMLESNYDENMILDNSYPAWLKNRIMGEGGHLSNIDCSNIIMRLAGDSLKEVYLSHISDDSNSEKNAYEYVTRYLQENFSEKEKLPIINVSRRLEVTEILNDNN